MGSEVVWEYRRRLKKFKSKYEAKIRRERNIIISTLLHDIKTPILAHIQSIELFLRGCFGRVKSTQAPTIEEILRSHYFLLEVINDLAFLLRIENKDYALEFEMGEIVEEIKNSIALLKDVLKEKELKLKTQGLKKRAEIKMDKKITKKVIKNIVSAGVALAKEKSEIEVDFKESKIGLCFFVKVQTSFITQERLNCLFDKNNSSQQDFNQLGMSFNLNFIKRLIEAQNWELIANSSKDKIVTLGFLIKK